MPIRQDVCRIQQLDVMEAADGAGHLVRAKHPLTECLLMDPLADGAQFVEAAKLVTRVEEDVPLQHPGLVGLDGEGVTCRVVGHDVHRPDGQVLSGHQPVKVDQGDLALHGPPEPDIVRVVGVGASISVDDAVRGESVVVGSLPPLDRWCWESMVGAYDGVPTVGVVCP